MGKRCYKRGVYLQLLFIFIFILVANGKKAEKRLREAVKTKPQLMLPLHYFGQLTLESLGFSSLNINICLFFYLFIYLFMAVLGLRFCARAFSSCGERGPLFIAVHGPLVIAASLVAEHRLQTRRLSSCGSRAQPLCSMWDLPRPGLEPVSPALAGRFSTTAPRGKPNICLFIALNGALFEGFAEL